MKKLTFWAVFSLILSSQWVQAQAVRIPQNTNYPCMVGRRLAATDIEIHWNAPGVKGREGKIWGTDLAYYGFQVLGYGSTVESPWRAGADECTTFSVSTDVKINGKTLAAGKYALFMALSADSTVLIFNKNTTEWGSYFYDKSLDVLRVATVQKKNQSPMQERLKFDFENQKDNSVDVYLAWESWKIPFTVEVDSKKTILANVQAQMSGELGFDPPSLIAAAQWCERNNVNYEQALGWINTAVSPTLGGEQTFTALSTKSKLLTKLGKTAEATEAMSKAVENGKAIELHLYGRQLLTENKVKEAVAVFETNHKKHNGAWPTNVGLMRGYSAMGDLKKALQYAKLALAQAPDENNKKSVADAIKTLESGKAL